MTTVPTPRRLFSWLLAFARRQPVGEIAHQYQVLRDFALRRRVLVTLGFGISLAYLPPWLTATFYLMDVFFDHLNLRLLRGLDPASEPGRYLLALLSNLGLSMSFTALPALCWLVDEPLAKAYALAMVLIALIHHSTLRNVHLPLSITAAVGTSLVAVWVNTLLWVSQGDWRELAVTTISFGGATYYAMLTILAMHRLQADLMREREVARQANLAKTRFVAQLSHELRTPLNAIIGLSEAELLSNPGPETLQRMTILSQSARDLGDLLEDILDLSAIEAEELAIRPVALDLRGQIRSTTQLFQRPFDERGMVLDLTFAEDLPEWVMLDGKRLRQCLSNILTNAVKYGGRGRVQVEVGRQGEGLALQVTDSGPGVAEALRDRIFEPFVRGHDLTPGTGLGLAISRMLARRMGGDLVLLPPRPGAEHGAQFLLTLPFRVLPGPPARHEPETPQRLDGMRVLVVDDIATNRLVAATYLRLLGAEALQASDGAAALQVATAERPDVILMDLLMPGMDGAETRDRLAARMGAELPPVIALSAETGARGAFAGHLVKPLTLDRLREALAPFHRP